MLESKLSNLSGFDLVEGKFRPRDEIKVRVANVDSSSLPHARLLWKLA